MDDAKPALLGQRDRHVRFGNGVHGGADDRNIDADFSGKLSLGTGTRRNYIGARRQQQDVVESKGLRNGKMNHKCLGIPQRCG